MKYVLRLCQFLGLGLKDINYTGCQDIRIYFTIQIAEYYPKMLGSGSQTSWGKLECFRVGTGQPPKKKKIRANKAIGRKEYCSSTIQSRHHPPQPKMDKES